MCLPSAYMLEKNMPYFGPRPLWILWMFASNCWKEFHLIVNNTLQTNLGQECARAIDDDRSFVVIQKYFACHFTNLYNKTCNLEGVKSLCSVGIWIVYLYNS